MHIRWIAALLLLCFRSLGADVIYLKSGGRIICNEAWVEGDVVWYRIDEGLMGFPAGTLDRIEKTEPVERPKPQPSKAPAVSYRVLPPADGVSEDDVAYHRASEALARDDFRGVVRELSGRVQYSLQTALLLAYAHIRLEEWGSALSVVEPLLVEHDDDAILNYYLGLCHSNLGHDVQALRYLRRSLEIRDEPTVRELMERLQNQDRLNSKPAILRSPHFVLQADADQDMRLASQILDELERQYAQHERTFSSAPNDELQVLLTNRRQFFDVTKAPEWSLALNAGRVYLPVGGLVELDDATSRILSHELAHSFIYSLTHGNVPIWLNEGISMYLAGENLDDFTGILASRASQNRLVPLASLEQSFMGFVGAESAELAYAESLAAARYLIGLYGFGEVARLLRSLGEGTPFDTALKQRFKMDYIELERNVHAYLTAEAERHPGEGIPIR